MTEVPLQDRSPSFCKRTPYREFLRASAVSEAPTRVQESNTSTPASMNLEVDGEGSLPASVHRSISVSESFVKLEAPASLSSSPGACRAYDNSSHLSPQATVLASEEPLQIQCGENTALLYVSKLCQGSKGPCILFQNEWLTPNELQYISGRETAKDWKRSIRYKGKSLKSLIARGMIRVHPPICDCLGCRISSPVNRGRLADKCGLSPNSPCKRKEQSKSTSSWNDEHLHSSRFFSASDIKQAFDRRMLGSNGVEHHEINSSSSESSEVSNDESVFCPAGGKRTRSLASPTMERRAGLKRRLSDSAGLYQGREQRNGGPCYDDGVHDDSSSQKDAAMREPQDGDEWEEATNVHGKNSSAFRTVLRDGSPAMNSHADAARDPLTTSRTEALQRDALARNFKDRGLNPAHTFFPPQFSQCLSTGALIRPGQNSPRLIADPYILASHASKMYQRAGLQSLQQSYMHYGLVSPVPQTFPPSAMLPDTDTRATLGCSPPRQNSSRCASPKESRDSRDLSRDEARHKGEGSGKAHNDSRVHGEESDQESSTQKSQASSPSSSDNPNSVAAPKPPLHKRVPRLHLDLSENVLTWNTDDVCHFVTAVTKSLEISQAFRDENIDGHSLVLMREEHLLDRMSVKLGPALKILAQVNKMVETTEIDKEANPT